MKGEEDADVLSMQVDFSVASLGCLQQPTTARLMYFYFPKEMHQAFFCLWTFAYAVLCTMFQLSLCLANSCFSFRAQLSCCLLWEAFLDSPHPMLPQISVLTLEGYSSHCIMKITSRM